jgi:hypothetical protein
MTSDDMIERNRNSRRMVNVMLLFFFLLGVNELSFSQGWQEWYFLLLACIGAPLLIFGAGVLFGRFLNSTDRFH